MATTAPKEERESERESGGDRLITSTSLEEMRLRSLVEALTFVPLL
jgi:hypothetical protein